MAIKITVSTEKLPDNGDWVTLKDSKDTMGYFILGPEWVDEIICLECIEEYALETKGQAPVTFSRYGGGLSCDRCGKELEPGR